MADDSFNAARFMSGVRSDEYVQEIGLPGTAKYGPGQAFINNMIEAKTAFMRPQFNQFRQTARMGTDARLGGETITGQRATAMNEANIKVAGMRASTILGAETEAEGIRSNAERAYLGHKNFMDRLRFDATVAEEELDLTREDQKFGWWDALGLASNFVP